MSEAGEEIVEYWLNSKGYFIMKNLKIRRNKEIDFLAITLGEPDEMLTKKAHIEVHVAAYSRAIGGGHWPPSTYAERIVKTKFEDPVVVEEVVKRLGEGYGKVAIWGSYGRRKPDREARKALFDELGKRGVTVIPFEEVLEEVEGKIGTGMHMHPALRTIQYYKFKPEW